MSEHYRALTRKYRPRTFEDIVSQGHVSGTLRNAIQEGRLAHAYLFCGPRGVGKTTMARVLARAINGIGDEVDGEAITQNLNIIEIDAASNNSVDDVRMLRDTVIVPPPPGQSKVYIIDEVHMLSKAAFNALLKTLEEPPPYVVFIFATTEPHKILPTILSRCQRFDFRRISVSEIVSRLGHICGLEGITIDEESLHHIARKADGALRDALGLLDQVVALCGLTITAEAMMRALNIVSTERLFEMTDIILRHDSAAAMALTDHLLAEGYDMQEFLVEFLGHLRNLFVARDVANLRLIESTDELRDRYKAQSGQFSSDDLMRMIHIVLQAQNQVKDARQPRIQVEIALLKLTTMERSNGLQALMQEIASLKQFLEKGGAGNSVSPNTQETAAPVARPQREIPASSKPPILPPAHSGTVSKPGSDIFGPPAVRRPGSEDTQASVLPVLITESAQVGMIAGTSALAAEPEPVKAPARRIILEDIRARWADFLEYSRDQVPQVMFFAMKTAQIHDLERNEVYLHCQDAFSQKLLEEHKKALSGLLSSFFEAELRARITLQSKQTTAGADDPFTRFKQIVQTDPKIRLMVDLFGAELEY